MEIGARVNPRKDYQNDVCIYVKPNIKPDIDFNFEGKPYLDMVDGFNLIHTLLKYPEIPAIVFSEHDLELMSRLVKNKIIMIPHQHVNFERELRQRDQVTRVGVIGSPGAFEFIPEEIKQGIKDRGMKLEMYSTFFPRTSVTKYYKNIDVALVWRPYERPYKKGLYNPFKIVNASAFGVPTIALDEPAFKEMDGCYIPVDDIDGFFRALDDLRSSKTLYKDMADLCIKKSERYHIENIGQLYKDLCTT